ncbi:MAG TPA: hypothetical protein EYO59_00050 [Chromatiaceae bacterium]|nr:hypothetical protein [Flavobacteriales bacterium]HIB83023.1 hypothetical protein [Chromatiaceae bacterium]
MPRERYFKYLPSLPYDAFDDSGQKKVVTDIFKRVRATLQARTDKTIYYKYTVRDLETPEILAYKYYDSTQLHWLILFLNEMRDPQWDWPLNMRAFDKYIIKKYGSIETAKLTTSHHETNELKATGNEAGYAVNDVVLKAGHIVESDFAYAVSDTMGYSNFQTTKEVKKYDHELALNEAKRDIILLRRNLAYEFVDEFDRLITKRR